MLSNTLTRMVLLLLCKLLFVQIVKGQRNEQIIVSASVRPNFVIFLADDMGWGDWRRTGSPARTPELDKMSRSESAIWFHRAYAGNPICSPTRASLHTGRAPARTCIYGVEQHILCRAGAGGCTGSEYTLGNATEDASRQGDKITQSEYLSAFYGKWHLGSISDRGIGSPDCYAKPANSSCQLGYWERNGGCCFGVDGQLDVSHPLHFGYKEFVATPECAASATTNCGCFFYPSPYNKTPCELGHYHHQHSGQAPYLECMQYYRGNISVVDGSNNEVAKKISIEPIDYVSSIDDEEFLVDQFEDLLERSVASGQPFLAVICFHGVHIPYVATPTTRATYPNMTENEQDYWGTITQIDTQVGRVRSLLRKHGIENHTWVSVTADNGPEVDPAGGQGTGSFHNPGRTAGLRGRKRDVTEGGTRVIGLVEYPAEVPRTEGGREEKNFPISTFDLLPTILDILNVTGSERPLDGLSLLPVLRGDMTERPQEYGIGIHGVFRFGSTNHRLDPQSGTFTFPDICPENSTSELFGDVPSNFSTVGNQPQFSWAEGNHLKLFGCEGHCDGTNCNSTSPGYYNKGWRFFLFNVTADANENVDIWKIQRETALAMFARFQAWQSSVVTSQGPSENGCAR